MNQVTPDPGKIAFIGAPSSAGARKTGQEQAPTALRKAGLIQSLQSGGNDVFDMGDIEVVSFSPDTEQPKQQNLSRVVDVLKQVENQVNLAVTDRKWPLVIGGDCTITIGVLATLTRHFPRLGLIYIDGDVDLNTPETTHTGILDGMVLAHILGKGNEELSHFGPTYPMLDGRNITLFGYSAEAGGIDPIEKEHLKVTSMNKYPFEKVKEAPAQAAIAAIKDLESRVDHILVHFDVDVIDNADFPAVDVHHDPGLAFNEVQEALKVFLKSPKTIGLVVTEFNSSRDSDGKLARRLADMIREAK